MAGFLARYGQSPKGKRLSDDGFGSIWHAGQVSCVTSEKQNATRPEADQTADKYAVDEAECMHEWNWLKNSTMYRLLLVGCAIISVLWSQELLFRARRVLRTTSPPDVKDKSTAGASSSFSTSTPLPILDVFQVHQPVILPSGPPKQTGLKQGQDNGSTIACTILLMDHAFGYSYGLPFVGNYTPPSCNFNRVAMNFTVTSRGRQFDRLALMYLGDTEVWRTSTAEPTAGGIEWTYVKDMSEYLYFWKQPQKIIFDLGNIIDDTYTGFFNTTLTATFYNAPETVEPAALILPISARRSSSDAASLFMVPSDRAINSITIPRNANRAVFSISACGQAAEEFWWSNVLQSDIDTFASTAGPLPGWSPWREVQLLIDGKLAGVEWPFPVIFTGGVVPGLWRPIVGIDAFDLREHEIDITPWLSLLCDGNPHTFEILVAGLSDNGGASGTVTETVGDSWYVTGKIFLWLDNSPSSVTTGTPPTPVLPPPLISLSQSHVQDSDGTNETLAYRTSVTRSLSISSIITTQRETKTVTWSQQLSYTNQGLLTKQGFVQLNDLATTGLDNSLDFGISKYKSSYRYPLVANTSYNILPDGDGNFTLTANIQRGLSISTAGISVFPSGLEANTGGTLLEGWYLHTSQNGSAFYFGSPKRATHPASSLGFGSTQQEFDFGCINGTNQEFYRRAVQAVNGTVVRDFEKLVESVIQDYHGRVAGKTFGGGGFISPKEALGRVPGRIKMGMAEGDNDSG